MKPKHTLFLFCLVILAGLALGLGEGKAVEVLTGQTGKESTDLSR